MKITLFSYNASRYHTNLAIRVLRDALYDLEKTGENVPEISICEFSLKDKRLTVLSSLYKENADIYAFSAYIWNITDTLNLAENLKKIRPESKIVFGGPEVGYRAKEFLSENEFVDTVICFDGEEAIKKLVRCYPELPKIIIGTKDPDFVNRKPHYFDRDGNPENLEKGLFVYYESTRGCPFKCGYCLSGESTMVEAKTAEKALEDLKMFERLPGGKRTIKMVDRTFNYNAKRAHKIWTGLLDESYTHCYHFEIEPALMDDKGIEILSKAPLHKFQLEAGIQSTNIEVLKACNRGANLEKELANLEKLKKLKTVPVHVDLICGLPKDTLGSIIDSINEVYYLSDELQIGFLKLLSGTAIDRQSKEYGMKALTEPPYEVLCTNTLSFEEMCGLHELVAVFERVANSGKFANSLEFLLGKKEGRFANAHLRVTPYDFFAGFAKFLGVHPSYVAQSKMYEKVYEYGLVFCKTENEKTEYQTAVRTDFLSNERTHIPVCLRENRN